MAKQVCLVRAGHLAGYIDLAGSLQLDAFALLRGVGLHPLDLTDVDAMIPASAVTDLLERSASAAGIEDFGLRLATVRSLKDIGPVGLLVREEQTIGEAIKAAERYLSRYSEAIEFRLIEQQNAAVVRVQYIATTRGRTRQATELLVGTVHRVLSALAGGAWAAEYVSFSHPQPKARTLHSSFFRTQILFDCDFNGFILHPSYLGARIRMAEMAMPQYMKQIVEEIVAEPAITIDATVRQLVYSLLASERCSSTAIASHLGVARKTLTRRLAARGMTYSIILNDVRLELARRYIRTGRCSLTETAQRLGFSSLSTFSRWFRSEFGVSATRWRQTDIGQGDERTPRRANRAPAPGAQTAAHRAPR